MDLFSLISTFIIIFIAEFGDKTQLAVISLSCNHKWTHVFAGAMLAFLAIDGISLAVGGPLLALLPLQYIQVISGIVFILFGIFPWLRKGKEETKIAEKANFPMLTSFSLIALMELGDKSQILGITLAAETHPILVFVGMIIALTTLTALAVLLGAKLLTKLPLKWLKIGTSILFIIIGIVALINAIFQLTIL